MGLADQSHPGPYGAIYGDARLYCSARETGD